MNDFLLDPCDRDDPHRPHRYGRPGRDERDQLVILHPLFCGGYRPEDLED